MRDAVNEVLERLDDVKYFRSGDYYMARCPGRDDRTPSLSIRRGDDGRVLLHDFGGSTTEEIVEALGMTMGDLFADDTKGKRPMVVQTRPRKQKEYRKPVVPEGATFKQGAINWFGQRGISEATMKHFGVYAEKHFFRKVDGEDNAICIPYRKDGQVVNIKYRAAGAVKDFMMEAGSQPIWFNLDAVLNSNEVIIVEGELDVMAMHEAGITNVISPPNGCESITEEVWESGQSVLGNETVRIILAGDSDKPGKEMQDDIARRVGKERCASVRWPKPHKDANDVLIHEGALVVAECVKEASEIPMEGIIHVLDVSEQIWQMFSDGLPRGTETGIAAIDEIYTIKPGCWTCVTGSPGSGKTNILDQILCNIAERDGSTFSISSLENKSVARHTVNLIPKYVKKSFRDWGTGRMTAEELGESELWMDKHFTFIQPEEPTVESVLKRAKHEVFARGIRGLVIDPWNELDHPPSGLNNGDYISRSLSLIRNFAFQYDVHVWLVAHPTKLVKTEGQYPVATQYDISGSAHFFNKEDFGISVWRNLVNLSDPVQFYVQKSRYAEIASIGKAILNYDYRTTRYWSPNADGVSEWRPKMLHEMVDDAQEFVTNFMEEAASD